MSEELGSFESLESAFPNIELSNLRNAYEDHVKELARLQARITELEKFVSACRYAGPYGVEKLREEAKRLFSKRKSVEWSNDSQVRSTGSAQRKWSASENGHATA